MTSKQDPDSEIASFESLGVATGSISSNSQNDIPCNSSNHTGKNSESGFSRHERALHRLGTYLCDLRQKRKMRRTSHDEDQKIIVLFRYLRSDRSDPEGMIARTCPDGWLDFL